MKIASIYDFKAFPPKGGNHVHALQLIRCFQAAGHEVLTWGDDSVPDVRSFERTEEGFTALHSAADVLYVRIDGNKINHDPTLAEALGRATKPMVWEINAPANENLAFSWLGGSQRLRSWPMRWFDRAKRQLHAWKQMPAILSEERVRQRLAPRVYAAVCVSRSLARYAQLGLGIERAVVIPNGADDEAHRPDGGVAVLPAGFKDCLKVVYTGSPMYPWQGLDVLERTIELCERAGDPIRFILLMNQRGQREFAHSSALCLYGVPHEQVADYLRAADVGVVIHPEYWWSRWRFHGSPMKMYDYMACGLPVVAAALGQMLEVVEPGRNGVHFDNTPEDLRRVLLSLCGKQELLETMGREARADVEARFNWRSNAHQTVRILEAAVASSDKR